ncbi:Alpha/Beta hydrolase protein [Hyaloraphidium curvatum]|nr:Alpha/Beta hydrolase protein [Hyaloraphidium curvatum]
MRRDRATPLVAVALAVRRMASPAAYVAAGLAAAAAAFIAARLLRPVPAAPGLPAPGTPAFAALSPADQKALSALYPPSCLPGSQFADLSRGRVHYYLSKGNAGVDAESPPDASDDALLAVVLGIGSPTPVYRHMLTPIGEKHPGTLVLVFDHYGRGMSDGIRGGGPYDMDAYVGMLEELLNSIPRARALLQQGKLALLGSSMGGAVCANYAARHPSHLRSLGLIAPAGLLEARGVLAIIVSPLGRLLIDLFEPLLAWELRRRTQPPGKDAAPTVLELEDITALYGRLHSGYFRSTLRSLADGVVTGQQAAYRALGKLPFRPVILWGTADIVVPFSLAARAKELAPNVELVVVEGAGHDVAIAEPARFVELAGRLLP